jgi:cysteate synthase
MVSAWQQRRRSLKPEIDMPEAPNAIKEVMSPVLTNRSPPYSIGGGLFDALQATDGHMYAVSNDDGKKAMTLIRDTLEIDPDPAAAVATAALVQAAEAGTVGPDDSILLNITGGGYERIQEDYTLFPIEPAAVITAHETGDNLKTELAQWVARYG